MSRKVFLSFLGNNNYKKCKYISKEYGESEVVTYVQEAIIDLYCTDFSAYDKVYIFLTQAAESKHWFALESIIQKKGISYEAKCNIPEGYSEEQIWKIFDLVFNSIQENDEIILDVTHGFRSLPMLEIVLLNYAKSLKGIKVKNILYGAFEALGPAYEVETKFQDPKDRKAPLLDLTAFSAIQAWTFGAESFIQTGQTKTITALSKENIKPILIESGGKDETANSIRFIMDTLKNVETSISTNRGKAINEENKVSLIQNELIKLIDNSSNVFAPLRPILEQIKSKFSSFDNNAHWEASVEWCINHGLIQQGITQLQEGVISYICSNNKMDSSNLEHREIAVQALHILANEYKEEDWHSPAKENKDLVEKILNSEFTKSYIPNYISLSEYRNDINHGGYLKKAVKNGARFGEKLKEHFETYKSLKTI